MSYNFQVLQKEELAACIDDLADLRISVFREYPYLYDGNLEYEKKYLKQYLITFCEVVSPKNDPRRPPDYFCLDEFWTRRGFVKIPDLVTQFSWKEIDSEDEFYHPMVFWSKKL